MDGLIRDILAIRMNVGAARRAASDFDLSALLLHAAAILFLAGQIVDRFDSMVHEWEKGQREVMSDAKSRHDH